MHEEAVCQQTSTMMWMTFVSFGTLIEQEFKFLYIFDVIHVFMSLACFECVIYLLSILLRA